MADLEAVLADVSYLMAMEKSKSTPAARASKKIVLPDPSVRSVMHKYMEKNNEVSFDKIFNQKLGYLLFKEYCETLHAEPVPQLYFYEEICKYERLETDKEREAKAREIYDTYVMGEELGRTAKYPPEAVEHVWRHLKKNQVPTTLFQPYVKTIFEILESVYEKFLNSEKYTRFCQWKNLELNIQLSMNDFSFHRIIGRGGFGEVYGCRKADTGKMYAMKCLEKRRIKMKQGEMLALNERIMLSLVSTGDDCPFIVNMTYAFQTPEKLYFVLDLMNGGDLHYHLSQHGKFCESDMRFYAAEVILGLEHMHNRHVVYRDLKPANILLDEYGHIRISDLGLACDFSKRRPQASVGTHGYMAPEVLCKGQSYDSSADWFSLGCMLYKLLRGAIKMDAEISLTRARNYARRPTSDLDAVETLWPQLVLLLGVGRRLVSLQRDTNWYSGEGGSISSADLCMQTNLPFQAQLASIDSLLLKRHLSAKRGSSTDLKSTLKPPLIRRQLPPKSHSPFRQHKSTEMPESFSLELKSLLSGLLQRDVGKRLGCRGRGAEEVKAHPFFRGIDWRVVYLQRLNPPIVPARGEVNAADAFDIGSFDDDDVKHVRLTDADQELYRNFPVVVSERWQHEIAETIFDYINHEADKAEMKRKNKNKSGYQEEENSDCILHGYMKRLGGTFTATWLTRYVRLYPNRLEIHCDTGKPPELIFMDQIEEVCEDYVHIKGEQCIVLKLYNHTKYVLTNSDEIGLKEWHGSLRATHNNSLDMMTRMAEKATKIYGTEVPLKHIGKRRQQLKQAASAAQSGATTASGGRANLEQKIIQRELSASASSRQAVAAKVLAQKRQQHLQQRTDPTKGSSPSATRSQRPGSSAGPGHLHHAHSHQHAHGHHHHQHMHRSLSHKHHHHHPERQASGTGSGSGASSGGHLHHHHHHHHHHHSLRQQHKHHQLQPLPSKRSSERQQLSVEEKIVEDSAESDAISERTVRLNQTSKEHEMLEATDAVAQPIGSVSESTVKPSASRDLAPPSIDLTEKSTETSKSAELQRKASSESVSSTASSEGSTTSCSSSSSSLSNCISASADEQKQAQQVKEGEPVETRLASSIEALAQVQLDETKVASGGTSSKAASREDIPSLRPSNSTSEIASAAKLGKLDPLLGDSQEKLELGEEVGLDTSEASLGSAGPSGGHLKLVVSIENVTADQEVLRDPSKRITSDNKQRELDLMAQYEKLNVSAAGSSSSSIEDG